jgi:ribonuclease BN (tRNA processing enzyme)
VRLEILGSGGWIPTGRRETCCYVVRRGSEVLIIDAGTGLRRLLERPDLIEEATAVNIVLSHFHLDHVVGLSYLPALDLPETVALWGPGRELYGASTQEILERLLGSPFFPAGLASIASEVIELGEGSLSCGGFAVRTRRQQRHSEPTLAFRIEDAITYCTDTAFDPGNVEFSRHSRLLLHEAWYGAANTDDLIHSAAGEAARIAHEAGAGQLVLIHVNPLLESEEALVDAARRVFTESQVGSDLESFELG